MSLAIIECKSLPAAEVINTIEKDIFKDLYLSEEAIIQKKDTILKNLEANLSLKEQNHLKTLEIVLEIFPILVNEDKRILSASWVFLYYFRVASSKITEENLSHLIGQIKALPNADTDKLRLLTLMHNILGDPHPHSLLILQEVIGLASKSETRYIFTGFIDDIEQRLGSMKIKINDKISLCQKLLTICQEDILLKEKRDELLLAIIKICDEEYTTGWREPATILKFVTELINSKSQKFDLDTIIAKKSVQESLKSDAKLQTLTTYILEGNINAFLKNQNDYKEYNTDVVTEKIRYQHLASLLDKNPVQDFASLAKELQLQENKVELWVVQAIQNKVVRAKIDQIRKRISFTEIIKRNITQKERENVIQKAKDLRSRLEEVKQELLENK